jgi:hypothetical protein
VGAALAAVLFLSAVTSHRLDVSFDVLTDVVIATVAAVVLWRVWCAWMFRAPC